MVTLASQVTALMSCYVATFSESSFEALIAMYVEERWWRDGGTLAMVSSPHRHWPASTDTGARSPSSDRGRAHGRCEDIKQWDLYCLYLVTLK